MAFFMRLSAGTATVIAAAVAMILTLAVPLHAQGTGSENGRERDLQGRDGDDSMFPPPGSQPPKRVIIRVIPPRVVAPPRRVVTPPRVTVAPPRVAPPPVPADLPDHAPDEIVALDLSADDLAALVEQGFEVIETTTLPGLGVVVHRLRIPDNLSLVEARDVVRALPTGGTADFNHFYRALQADPGCAGVHCAERTLVGWPTISGRELACGGRADIGMIDSGINGRHETFDGARLELIKLPAEPESPSQEVHGTAVAALLIGDPSSRSPGLVPGARVVAVDAFYREGADERTDAYSLLEAMGILADRGVRVMNLSLAGPDNAALAAVVGLLTMELDIVVVAAVGNSGPDAPPAYPAAYAPVVAVTAVDRSGALYDRAVRGNHVDLAAPGVEVWTAASVKGAKWKTGTSFAAPFVTAAAAILRASDPNLRAAEVAEALRTRARDLGPPGPDPEFGAGLLNLGGLCDGAL